MKWYVGTALLAAIVLRPGGAAAFSDPAFFDRPALEGGGGGRHFTGSPVDGLSCGVCHQGGAAPEITVTGLPKQFVAGARYEVTLQWQHPEISHALELELIAQDKEGFEPEIPLPEAMPAASRCDGLATGQPAVYKKAVGARWILGVEDCGASLMSFAFTAPKTDKLYFAMGAVKSNGSSTAQGDGVLEMREVIVPDGVAGSGSCSFARDARTAWTWPVLMSLALARWLFRSRKASGTANPPSLLPQGRLRV